MSPRLNALSASSDEVVASDSGLSYFCTEASDSPSFLRKLEPAWCSEFSTASLLAACTSSRASDSPGPGVHRIQRDHVLAAQIGDRTVQHGLDADPLADFASHVAGDALIRRPSHELQSLPHFLLGEDIQIRRLLQIHRQRFLERAVKNRVRRGIHKIGDQDGVSLGHHRPGAAQEDGHRQSRARPVRRWP